MSGYLKHLYEEMSRVVVTKWEAVYVGLAEAGLAMRFERDITMLHKN